MKKSKVLSMQQSTPFGGSLNEMSRDYKISERPIGDESKWGYLAYVSDDVRQRILETGFGETQAHIEYIKKSVKYIRKMRKKSPHIQLGLDF